MVNANIVPMYSCDGTSLPCNVNMVFHNTTDSRSKTVIQMTYKEFKEFAKLVAETHTIEEERSKKIEAYVKNVDGSVDR